MSKSDLANSAVDALRAPVFGAVGVLSSYCVAKASQMLPLVAQNFTLPNAASDLSGTLGGLSVGMAGAVVGTMVGATAFKKAIDSVAPQFWEHLAEHKMGQLLIEINETFGNWHMLSAKSAFVLGGASTLLSPVGEPLTAPAVIAAAAILPLTFMKGLANRRAATEKNEESLVPAYSKPRSPGR